MAEERIGFRCGHCGNSIVVSAQYAGRRVRCKTCEQVSTVPASEPPAGSASTKGATRAEKEPEQEQEAVPTAPFWTPANLFVLGVLSVPLLAGLLFGNLATRVFVMVIVLSVVNGYWLGASRVAAGIGGMLVALLLAVPLGRLCEGLFAGVLGYSGLLNRMISIGGCGVLLAGVVAITLSIPIGRWLKDKPGLKRYDKLIGTSLGFIEGSIFAVLMLWAVLALEPLAARNLALAEDPSTGVKRSTVSASVARLAGSARESVVGQAADVVNPLRGWRMITVFTDAQSVLSNPRQREAFLTHPAIERIRAHPAFQRAAEMLAEHPDIADLEDGVTPAEIQRLMQSEELLAILDETNLMSELAPLAAEIESAIQAAKER
jgi:hypothetical protein